LTQASINAVSEDLKQRRLAAVSVPCDGPERLSKVDHVGNDVFRSATSVPATVAAALAVTSAN